MEAWYCERQRLEPKGMHWRTFMRLFVEYNASIEQSLAGMALRFGIK